MTNSKQNNKMKLLYGVLFCFMCHVEAQTPSENYPHSAVLDSGSKVHLYWKFNDTYITFEVNQNYCTIANLFIIWVEEYKIYFIGFMMTRLSDKFVNVLKFYPKSFDL